MEEPNPYESPKAESGPPPRPDINPYYRLQRFLIVVGSTSLGAGIGYYVLAFFSPGIPPNEVGAGVGGAIGLILGVVYRIATRRR